MISCEKDGPYIGFSHCPVCSAKYATEMGQNIRALETALAAAKAEGEDRAKQIAELRAEGVSALATMTAERDARDVAIGVLGESLRREIHMLTCYRLQRRPSEASLAAAIKATASVNANPLARAAVEGER